MKCKQARAATATVVAAWADGNFPVIVNLRWPSGVEAEHGISPRAAAELLILGPLQPQ